MASTQRAGETGLAWLRSSVVSEWMPSSVYSAVRGERQRVEGGRYGRGFRVDVGLWAGCCGFREFPKNWFFWAAPNAAKTLMSGCALGSVERRTWALTLLYGRVLNLQGYR